MALGAFLSGPGQVSAPLIFVITWVCNVAGAAGVYLFAHRVGRPFIGSPSGRRLLQPAAVARLERLYARYGAWGIFLSRFIPGVRAVIPPFAGVAGLPARRALVPAALASAIWYGALTYIISRYVDEIHEVARFVDRFNAWTLGGAAVVVAVIVVMVLVRRRAR